jgi:hypothetical protein
MNIVKNGFYELFLDFNTNREDVKKFFDIAISEKLQNLPEKAKIIRSFLFNQFPELFFKQRELRGKNTSLKNKLREFESEIFENNIGKNHKKNFAFIAKASCSSEMNTSSFQKTYVIRRS